MLGKYFVRRPFMLLRKAAETKSSSRAMASALVTKFDDSVEKSPMRDAMRYTMLAEGKWTASEFKVSRY
jgi:hypothetical protein